jgi:hypothetical protein
MSASSPWRISPSKSSTNRSKRDHKSRGISPTTFHNKNQQTNSTNPWKQTVENTLLIQQHEAHVKELEAKRKQFRKETELKVWPLQGVAMEHVDYLIKEEGKGSQFHGGEYPSGESASSIASGTSRPRSSNVDGPRVAKGLDSSAKSNASTLDNVENNQQTPLWSLEPRIFAIEKAQGKRKYLVGQFGRIADWYWRKATHPRHLYEVIREATPCRLYFDLEYSKVHNNGNDVPLNASELLREFREELAIDLKKYYGLDLTTSQIINLDSSNDKKFSRHWIVHLTEQQDGKVVKETDKGYAEESSDHQENNSALREVLFRDAPTVGRFVKRLVSRLAEEIAVQGGDFSERRPTLANYLFVNTKDANKPTCFVDLGVYTRNRLFRCIGSSKFGKTHTLQVMTHEEDSDEFQYMPLSLPSHKKVHSSQASLPLSMEEFIFANDWEPHAKVLANSLVVPLREWPQKKYDEEKETIRILDVEDELYGSMTANTLLVTAMGASTNGNVTKPRRAVPTISMARQGSRIPSLDNFVSDVLARRGGTQGSIRAWSVEYGPRDAPVSVTYQMQKNRFCEMIGRSHKSNNIFWTVDLTSWTCFQGCHDPECYGRGSPVPIPNDEGQLDAIKSEFEEWQEEEFEKALMNLNLDDIVAQAKASSSAQSQQTAECRDFDTKKDDDESPDGGISDEALMQAILDNPELFQ